MVPDYTLHVKFLFLTTLDLNPMSVTGYDRKLSFLLSHVEEDVGTLQKTRNVPQ